MKKFFSLLSVIAVIIIAAVCFGVSADDGTVVIDNVVYELTSEKYGKYDFGEHYVVSDFFDDETLAETTTKINIVDEIDGVEVLGINTNYNNSPDLPSPVYTDKYPNVKKIIIPDSIKYIGFYAFNCFPGVEKLYLPEELVSIGDGAFYGMESLKSICIPSNVTTIPERAFEANKALTKVVFSGNVEIISERAFAYCESLTTISLPVSLKGIYDNAFFSNTALAKVVINEGIENIREGAFEKCTGLKKIVFEDTSEDKDDYISIDDAFFGCIGVKEIFIKTIPTKGILFSQEDISEMKNLKKINFAGSEEKWNDLVLEGDRKYLENRGIEVVFYYRHSHKYIKSSNVTCTKGGTCKYVCECGDSYSYTVSKNTEGHKFGGWKVTKKATYTVEGEKQRTCSVCGKKDKKAIAKLELNIIDTSKIERERYTDKIKLTWEGVEDATGYRVYKKNTKTGEYERIASIKGKTTYTVKGLSQNKEYYFQIQPYYKDSKGTVAFGYVTPPFFVRTLSK